MAKREILAGVADQTVDVFIQDSSSTVGAGLTGLVFNTASLVCYYRKGATGTPTALTLATQTVGGAHSDGGFVAVDGTNCPGQYRLDLSDTIVATAGMATLYLRGATNMMPCVLEIEIVSINKFDAVRMGLTALPNAAAEASGGLATLNAAQASNGTIRALLADTVTHGGSAAKLELGSASATPALLVQSSGGDAARFAASGGNGDGLEVSGHGSGAGLRAKAGVTGIGIRGIGGDTSGGGIAGDAPTLGDGISADGAGVDGFGIAGYSAAAHGGYFEGGTNGDGVRAVKAGTGVDIRGDITGVLSTLAAALDTALDAHEGPDIPGGTVTTDAGNSATSFETSRAETTNDFWKDALLLITSGALVGQVKKVTAYNGTTKFMTVAGGYTATPADGVTFLLINR